MSGCLPIKASTASSKVSVWMRVPSRSTHRGRANGFDVSESGGSSRVECRVDHDSLRFSQVNPVTRVLVRQACSALSWFAPQNATDGWIALAKVVEPQAPIDFRDEIRRGLSGH